MATTRTDQITDIAVRLFKAFINNYPLRPPIRRCASHGALRNTENGQITYRMYCFTKE